MLGCSPALYKKISRDPFISKYWKIKGGGAGDEDAEGVNGTIVPKYKLSGCYDLAYEKVRVVTRSTGSSLSEDICFNLVLPLSYRLGGNIRPERFSKML